MVLNVGESFLFLPKHTGIGVLQAGGVLALKGGGRKGAPATQPDAAQFCRICAAYGDCWRPCRKP